MHGRQRLPRHPRHAGGGPPRRPLRHLPRGRVRRPRLPRHRPGQRAGLAVVRGVRRRHAARRAQRRGARPRAHPRPAHRPAVPAHRVRGRRRPPHPAGDAALRSLADRRTCALRVEITPVNHDGEITVESAARRHGGATSNGCRSTPRAPRSRWRRAGRSGRSPATSTARSARPTGTSPTWRCAPSRAASRSATRRRPLPSVEPHRSGFTVEDERIVWRATFPGGPGAAGQARAHRHVARRRRRRAVQQGCLDGLAGGPGGRVRRDRRRERRRVGGALGRTATSRSTATRRAPRPCASASTTC